MKSFIHVYLIAALVIITPLGNENMQMVLWILNTMLKISKPHVTIS